MSAYRPPVLMCDNCGTEKEGYRDQSIPSLRYIARREGWATGWLSNRTRADFCPSCHAEGKGSRREVTQ